MARLVQKALANGIIVIAADPREGNYRYPARLPGVIAVSELRNGDNDNENGNESNTGKPGYYSVKMPNDEHLSAGPGGGYDFFRGSSVSTAVATGYTALLHEKRPEVTPEQRVNFLSQTMQLYSDTVSTVPLRTSKVKLIKHNEF